MQWHTILIAAFIVSISIVIATNYSDSIGWMYVFILLMAATLVWPKFKEELASLRGNTAPPSQTHPGQAF